MSVIPLVINGDEPTVVESQQDFDREGNAVRIGNLDPEQLIDKNTSNVSYDFRVGDQYRSHLERHPVEIPAEGTITLHPGSALIIQTAEYVHLPRRMFGIIAPKVSLLQQGLSTTFSKVDPGYNGHLLITLFNLGQTTQVLKKGQSFCAFSILDVSKGAQLYNKGPQQLRARIGQRFSDRIREWLEAHHVIAIMVLTLVDIILIVVTFFLAAVHLFTYMRSVTPHA